jgi:hypothetical protein
LLQLLSIKHHGSHFVITLAESWFYLSTDHEQLWIRSDEEPPERAKHTIDGKRIMVTIAWNPLGFHLVEALPKRRRFVAEYYRDNILTELIRLCPEAGERYVAIHADNAGPHTAHKCRIFAPKMDCAPPGIHPTRSITLLPLRLC